MSQKTSKTPQGRSATFRVQGLGFFFASIAARLLVSFFFLQKKKSFEPSREEGYSIGGPFFFW